MIKQSSRHNTLHCLRTAIRQRRGITTGCTTNTATVYHVIVAGPLLASRITLSL